MDTAIDYMVKLNTWPLETEYPYTATDGNCKTKIDGSYTILSTKRRSYSTTATLKKILDNEGAPSVAVCASTWSSYKGGVLTACCTSLNHGVQATGVDANGNWIVRNSWGTRWGEQGYIYLSSGNTCGVASEINTAE